MTVPISPSAQPTPADVPVRLLARAIDVALLIGIDIGLGRVMGFGFDWLIIGALIVYAYFVLLDTLFGATLGKLLLGVRVVGPDQTRPSLAQAAAREAFTLVGAVPFAGPFVALAAWIWIIWTMRSSPIRQGVHDTFAGGTRVVRR